MGGVSLVTLFFEQGHMDYDGDAGQTTLMSAAEGGHVAVVKMLLNTSMKKFNQKDKDGQTALSIASSKGHTQIVRMLLVKGKADTGSRDKDGRTPLARAAQGGKLGVVTLLLKNGKSSLNSKDYHGRTPFSVAAEGCHLDTLVALRQAGADPNFSDHSPRTPLSWAAGNGDPKTVEYLISVLNVNKESRDLRGFTPLDCALQRHQACFRIGQPHKVGGYEAVIRLLGGEPRSDVSQGGTICDIPSIISDGRPQSGSVKWDTMLPRSAEIHDRPFYLHSLQAKPISHNQYLHKDLHDGDSQVHEYCAEDWQQEDLSEGDSYHGGLQDEDLPSDDSDVDSPVDSDSHNSESCTEKQ